MVQKGHTIKNQWINLLSLKCVVFYKVIVCIFMWNLIPQNNY